MADRRTGVLFLTVGDRTSPGSRLRAMAYRSFLEERGRRVEVLVPMGSDPNRLRRRRLLRSVELVRDLTAAARADVVVVYRKTFPGLTSRLLRKVASKVVFEYDDAVYLPSPGEPQDRASVARYERNFRSTVAAADLVIAGNDYLARQAEHPRIEIVPTGVDLSVFEPVPRTGDDRSCVLGWIGTSGNLPQWEQLLPVFERLVAADPRIRFKIVSDAGAPGCGLPIEYEKWTPEREAACLEDFDIGLMPLEDTPWNRGKCSYKALQCMAMGIPVVLSPVGMNREVVEDGVSGFFASTDEEWTRRLLELAGNAELRSTLGRAARTVVEERFSLDAVATRMADLIDGLAG